MVQKNKIGMPMAALLGALLASLCCIIPTLALVGGISGFGASISWLSPLRPYLIAMAIVSLGFAWYRKVETEAECRCAEDGKEKFLQTKSFLGAITIAVILMAAFPWYSGIFYAAAEKRPVVSAKENLRTAEFKISGMTCNSCAKRVKRDVENLAGIITAEVSYENQEAVVTFDRLRAETSQISKIIESAGYSVTGVTVGSGR